MKHKIKLLVIFTIGILALIQDASASHIIGGNITYRYIGNDNYEITLVMRRDCVTGAEDAQFDDPASVYFFKSNGALAAVGPGLSGRLNMNFNPDDTLGNTFISDCGFEGTQVCVQETQYRDTIKLKYLEGGYTIAYQRCCRNPTIQNILMPEETGTTWWTYLSEESMLADNSTPVFNEWPDIYVCTNDPIDFDFSATDEDGDSLVYSLYTPHSGATVDQPVPNAFDVRPPYDEIVWNSMAGFGLDNLLGSAVPVTIDSVTGLLTGIPDFAGQYLIGVVVDEYRDGVLLSRTRRDFQYNVRVCGTPPTAEFTANDGNCDGSTVQFQNNSISASEFEWNFNYPSTDSAFISTEENPLFVYDEPGVYQVRLIATRGSDQCRSEIIKTVSAIVSEINVAYDLSIQSCNDDDGYTIRLTDLSTEEEEGFNISDVEWTITQSGFTGEFTDPVVTLDVNEDIVVSLRVFSETGCTRSVTDSIRIEDFEHVSDFALELVGCSDSQTADIILTDISDDINPYDSPISSSWTVTSADGEIMSISNPFELSVVDTGIITVDLTTNFGGSCSASISKEIDIETVVPQTSYTFIPLGCPEESTVELLFSIGPDSENPDYEVTGVDWSISVAGMEFTGSEELLTVIIPKDSLVTVKLTTSFDNGCIDEINETIIPGPFATIDFVQDENPIVVCIGDTIPLVKNGNPDFIYSWNSSDGLVFDGIWSDSNPGLIGISDRSYTVTVSDGLCSVESMIDVEVFDGDNLQIVGDSITCDGSVLLSATGGLLEGEYIWALDEQFSEIIHQGNTLNTSFEGSSETYFVSFTGETCDDPYAEFTVSLSEVFNVMFNGDPVRSCNGDTVPLLANYNPDLIYSWTPTNDLIFYNGNTSEAFTASATNQTFNVNIAGAFCDLDTTVSYEVSDIQQLTILGDSVICDDNVVLTASGAIGNGNYEWSNDPSFTTILSNNELLETTLEGNSAIYYVRYTDPICGDEVFSFPVRLYEFNLDYIDQWVICPGDSVQFPILNNGEQDLTFTWDEDIHIVNGTNNEMSPTIGIGENETDPFILYFTAISESNCQYRDSIEVSIKENSSVDISYELQECGQFTVCFDIIGDYEGFPNWDFGDPTVETDISIDQAVCYTYPAEGVYEVTLTNLANSCTFPTVTALVTINEEVVVDTIEPQVACLGSDITVTASSSDHNINYVWCTLDGDTLAIGENITVTVDSAYQIIVKGSDPNGCSGQTVVDISPFTFDIVDNVGEVFCDGQETQIELIVNGDNSGFNFDWGPEDCIQSGANTPNPVAIVSGDKILTVTITEISTGCIETKTYDISTTNFIVDAIAEPDTINPNDPTVLSIVDPLDVYTYEWDNGEIDAEITVTPEESTTYTVTVTDDLGCTAIADVFVFVRMPKCDETDVFIPNAFTPNEDNVNDVLFVRSNFLEELELIIFNRWGEEVFRTNDINTGWDGKYNGEELSPDVFAYYFKARCINGITYSKSGNVSLLK